jgi:hypothetical protein
MLFAASYFCAAASASNATNMPLRYFDTSMKSAMSYRHARQGDFGQLIHHEAEAYESCQARKVGKDSAILSLLLHGETF